MRPRTPVRLAFTILRLALRPKAGSNLAGYLGLDLLARGYVDQCRYRGPSPYITGLEIE